MGNTRNRYPGRRRFLKQSAALSAGAASLASPAIVLGHGGSGAKPVRILVGAPRGGTTDTVARAVAIHMAKALGQQVIVENRSGAGGKVAAEAVARSAPDGTTLLVSFTSPGIDTTLHPKPPFDPVADFTPITILAISQALRAGHRAVPTEPPAERGWFGLFAPAKLPAEITQRVYEAARGALAQPDVRRCFEKEALEAVGSSPAEFARFAHEDFQRREQLVRFAGSMPG